MAFEACLPFADTGKCYRDGLLVWVSQCDRVAQFIGVQVKVRQVEFVLVGLQSANCGLDEVHVLRFLAFDPVGVMTSAVLGVGREGFCQARLVRFAQDAFDPLEGFHEQLQADD